MIVDSDFELPEPSAVERMRVMELSWARFVQDPATVWWITEAERAELRRRAAALEAHPESARAWSEIRAELESE